RLKPRRTRARTGGLSGAAVLTCGRRAAVARCWRTTLFCAIILPAEIRCPVGQARGDIIMPVNFTIHRSTALKTDFDNDGYADAADVLRHILTITNNGTAATNVVLGDLLGGSAETGLVNISPIAFDD